MYRVAVGRAGGLGIPWGSTVGKYVGKYHLGEVPKVVLPQAIFYLSVQHMNCRESVAAYSCSAAARGGDRLTFASIRRI